MNVLWVCNFVPSFIARQEGLPMTCMGSWVESLAKADGLHDIQVTIACFYPSIKSISKGCADRTSYYIIPEGNDNDVVLALKSVIAEVNPEVLHIWGTEYYNALLAVRAFNNPEKTVVHIQGVCSAIALHYCSGIPAREQSRSTLKDFIRKTNIKQSRQKLIQAGSWEKEIIQNVSHVIGRTEFDRACTELMNPLIIYHECGEALREEIRKASKWTVSDCEKHTVFLSQGNYPVKGLHIALHGFAMLKKMYPDLKVYVAGSQIEQPTSVSQRLRQTNYSKYILKLISRLGLENTISFIGFQDGVEIAKCLQKANAYLLCSVIENSPNSLQEAMCVGTPVVASDVGGIKNYVKHRENGLIYQHDAYYMMAYYLKNIFEDDVYSTNLSECEQKTSAMFSEVYSITRRIKEIYGDICKE